ncbi:hypothetical protein [Rhodococcus sp. CX]|uniref:hypothetical protein n=2 Tax=unclassified Rhodococcus (in: high G+C Gram-positive bacteria) TaxID=192944 RepID=UPI0018CCA864|nr:hypothetical protein [Rhodococcus sp. CX]
MRQLNVTGQELKPRVATDGLFWGSATVMVPISLAFTFAIAIFVFEAFGMDDTNEPQLLVALVVLAAILTPLASAVLLRTTSRIRAGVALGVAVGSLVAIYGGVILVVR